MPNAASEETLKRKGFRAVFLFSRLFGVTANGEPCSISDSTPANGMDVAPYTDHRCGRPELAIDRQA